MIDKLQLRMTGQLAEIRALLSAGELFLLTVFMFCSFLIAYGPEVD